MPAKIVYIPVAMRHSHVELTMAQHSEQTRSTLNSQADRFHEKQEKALAEMSQLRSEGFDIQGPPTVMQFGKEDHLVYLVWKPD